MARYDDLASEYDAFVDLHSPYYAVAADALRRLLGPGTARCLDVGCGGGHFIGPVQELGWTVVGVDESDDQLRVARERHPALELVRADATALPFPAESFDGGFSTFAHTDFDDFAGAIREARRVGPAQEHLETGLPRLHPGYRRAGRWNASEAPGATPGGWRARLGSFVHLPLADLLSCFAGFELETVEELADGWDYPKTIALAFRKPR